MPKSVTIFPNGAPLLEFEFDDPEQQLRDEPLLTPELFPLDPAGRRVAHLSFLHANTEKENSSPSWGAPCFAVFETWDLARRTNLFE